VSPPAVAVIPCDEDLTRISARVPAGSPRSFLGRRPARREMKQTQTSRCPTSVSTMIARVLALLALLLACAAIFAGSDNVQLPASGTDAISPWRQAGFDAAHTAYNRYEQILSPSNVGQLQQAWASPVGAGTLYASPIVS